jgi:hypothetical protein
MRNHKGTLIITICALLLGTFTVMARRRRRKKGNGLAFSVFRKIMLKDKIINKYIETKGGITSAGWKDVVFRKTVKYCGANWHCKPALTTIKGKTNKSLREYYADGLVTETHKGYSEWVMTYIVEKHYYDAAYGAFIHGVPKLADLLAPTVNSKEKIDTLWHGYAGRAYWVLFYLGAKNKMKDMIAGLPEGNDGVDHVKAMYSFSQSWNLSKENTKALEEFCTGTVFQESNHRTATPYCLRWFGQINTKNKLAKRFVKKYINDHSYKLEAIRTAGKLNLKDTKSLLQGFLKKSYSKQQVWVKVGRKSKRKKIDTWSRGYNSIPSAVALYGMGDKTAKKAIKYWMKYDKKKSKCDHTAVQALFVEMLYASKKTQKKLKKDLKKLYKKMLKGQKKNSQLEGLVRRAALYFLQLGDTIGLKSIIKIIESGDNNNIIALLEGLGGDPTKWVGSSRGYAGLGHLTIGKKGLKAKVLKKIAKKLKSEFMMWNNYQVKGLANRTWFALNARILHAKNKL